MSVIRADGFFPLISVKTCFRINSDVYATITQEAHLVWCKIVEGVVCDLVGVVGVLVGVVVVWVGVVGVVRNHANDRGSFLSDSGRGKRQRRIGGSSRQ